MTNLFTFYPGNKKKYPDKINYPDIFKNYTNNKGIKKGLIKLIIRPKIICFALLVNIRLDNNLKQNNVYYDYFELNNLRQIYNFYYLLFYYHII